ncbi:MAG TPA: ATP-binding protein [Stellaceae bacterium]|nr:ATP-binding protein [Stellaceae bacterium]
MTAAESLTATDAAGTPGWVEANQRYLTRSLAALKSAIRRDAVPIAPPHEWAAMAPVFAQRPPALERIAEAFGLSPFERNLLLLCAGVELDPEVAALCIGAPGGGKQQFASFSFAFASLPEAHWSALAPGAPLRRWRLVEIAEGQPLTLAPLRIDETVLHCLTGIGETDRRLSSIVLPLPPVTLEALAAAHAGLAQQIADIWESPADAAMPLVQLVGDSIDCRPVLAAAATLVGTRSAVLHADRMATAPADLDELVRLWGREICLSGLGVLLIECDDPAAGEEQRALARAVTTLIERLPGPLALCERERSKIAHRLVASFDIAPPPAAEQQQAWRQVLRRAAGARFGEAAATAASEAIAGQFSMSRPAIDAVAAEAVAHAARLGRPDAIGDIAWDLCRVRSRNRLDALAQRIDSRVGWDDLVLPDSELATLRTIAAQLRHRATVYERWGFAAKGRRGLGITALFSGPSGTGKTMAAEVLAAALRLDLYRIDLASVVSKYIGETEKNLRQLFDAAELSGAILLFDEADALFGKRSEVKDSHDRYANIEVSYLLQRMEAYRGLAILTSNMRAALDPAFLRRLRFSIQFPFPDATQRRQIWRNAFPAEAPTGQLDFARLAQLRIAGGNIRSIALNAAFLAADAGEPIRMPHVQAAARSEYAKLERQLTAAELDGWT